jgi:hypothetical protein
LKPRVLGPRYASEQQVPPLEASIRMFFVTRTVGLPITSPLDIDSAGINNVSEIHEKVL